MNSALQIPVLCTVLLSLPICRNKIVGVFLVHACNLCSSQSSWAVVAYTFYSLFFLLSPFASPSPFPSSTFQFLNPLFLICGYPLSQHMSWLIMFTLIGVTRFLYVAYLYSFHFQFLSHNSVLSHPICGDLLQQQQETNTKAMNILST